MVLEHINNPEEFHTAIYNILNEDGVIIHFYSTLFSPGSIINLILPEFLSNYLLRLIQKRNWNTEGKFRAFYRWSLGPTKKQIKRFDKIGFKIYEFHGYLGSGYISHIPVLNKIEKLYNKIVFKINSPLFCTNAIVVLKKTK